MGWNDWPHRDSQAADLARRNRTNVRCKVDRVTKARKPIQGDWLTIKPFREMTYAQRQTYLNRIFGLKPVKGQSDAVWAAERAA